MFSIFRKSIVLVALAALSFSGVAAQAASAPVASAFKVEPGLWTPAKSRLAVSAHLSGAGTWQLSVMNVCTREVIRQLSGSATKASDIVLTIDGTVAPQLLAGTYRLTLTPAANGGATGSSVSTEMTVGDPTSAAAQVLPVCGNADRISSVEGDLGQIAAAALLAKVDYPNAKSVLLAPVAAPSSVLAVAASAAAQKGWPLLLTDGAKLSFRVKAELARRGATKVVLLGSEKALSKSVSDRLTKLGYRVVRQSADEAGSLTAKLYSPAKTTRPAVLVSTTAKSGVLLQAAAYANAVSQPLLVVDSRDPAKAQKLLKSLKLSGGVALGSAAEWDVPLLEKFPGVARVDAADLTRTSLALARTLDAQFERASLFAAKQAQPAAAFVSVLRPSVLLALGNDGLTDAQRIWLYSRGDITGLRVVTAEPRDGLVADVARLIAERGDPTAIPLIAPAELGALTAPANFAFSGAGWGHGVGMSQWGAYQQAVEGKTAAEILTYYFQGTTVGPAPADQDIFVSLQNRIASVKLRVLPLDGSAPTWRLSVDTSAGTKSVDLGAKHSVTLTYVDGAKVKVSISGPGDLSLPQGTLAKVTWSGTRYAGALGEEPALLQVAGPDETLTLGKADSGRRYRFGLLRVRPAAATANSDAGVQVVNRVRLADEYIYGIGEVSSSWPEQALQAQVIAARSYAYYDAYEKTGEPAPRSSVCDCQVYDDTRDQNYVGWSKLAESVGDRWKAAVDASVHEDLTSDVVLSGKTVVQAFFAASTGGYTQNIEDVWGGGAKPYFVSVPDPWSLKPAGAASVARWSPRVRAQKMLASAFSLPTVATLDFSDRFASGSVRTVTATAANGQRATITGEQFRSRVRSDTGSTLNSSWIWRSAMTPRLTSARLAAADLLSDEWLTNTKAPAATATTAVLVTQSDLADEGLLAVAAAYAGVRNWAFLPVAADGDQYRVRNLLQSRGITDAVLVGEVDADITAKLEVAKVSVRQIYGATVPEIAAELASESGAKSAILFDSSDSSTWPLAVSAAVASGAALLPTSAGELAPELSSYLGEHEPESVIAVGSVTNIPDFLMAGWSNSKRINTADLAVASRAALTLSTGVMRGVVLADAGSSVATLVSLAAYRLPLLYLDESNQAANLAWLRRQPLLAGVVDGGAAADLVDEFRKA